MASAIIFSLFIADPIEEYQSVAFFMAQIVLTHCYNASMSISSTHGGGAGEPSILGRRGGARHCEQNHTRMANYVKICTGFDRLQLK